MSDDAKTNAKGKKPSESEQRFKTLLRELFHTDRADLNFGIYRVMNQKRAAMDAFIDTGIVDAVDAALADAFAHLGGDDKEKIKEALKPFLGDQSFDEQGKLKEAAKGIPMGQAWELLEKGGDYNATAGSANLRDDAFNHLYNFFSRYYDEGDFMCKQRYAADARYAVPYNGEEVLMHWANKDQYYVKTAEHFSQYAYTASGKTIRFEMRDADLEADNNKPSKNKFFVPLVADKTVKKGILPFEYRDLTAKEKKQYKGIKKIKQDDITAKAVEALANTLPNIGEHLPRYVKRNTADYFIHKNLGGFLATELDYFINSELLNAEELVRNNANTRSRLLVAKAVRAAGCLTIDFLAQLENFQKSIWEKKKFITSTNYIVTLQVFAKYCKNLLKDIAKNTKQWQEWVDLKFIAKSERVVACGGGGGGQSFFKFVEKYPTLTVDTCNFDENFRQNLLVCLKNLGNLDEITDGVLFHSENWQALNLMQAKFARKIKCVYIDPPYNTGSDNFLYKDNYKFSSWLSMLNNRLALSQLAMSEDGVLFCSIGDLVPDEGASIYLQFLMQNIFPKRFGNLVWKKRSSFGSLGETDMTEVHEYILAHGNTGGSIHKNVLSKDTLKEYKFVDEDGNRYKFISLVALSQRTKQTNPNLNYEILFDTRQEKIVGFEYENEDGDTVRDYFARQYDEKHLFNITLPGKSVWMVSREVMEEHCKKGRIRVMPKKGNFVVEIKKFLIGGDGMINGKILKSVLDANGIKIGMNTEATGMIKDLFAPLDYTSLKPKPVSLIEFVVSATTMNQDIVLDYFAGSGTTAHAVINLNRRNEDWRKPLGEERRKFVLVEMGEYFSTVLMPRIKKVIFSPDWKDGEPSKVATEFEAAHSPRLIKYHRIESYDDALANIQFDDAGETAVLLSDYTPRYMLEAETGNCASFAQNGDAFKNPFAYTLLQHRNGKAEKVTVDLPETFAYLIGLQEHTRETVKDGKRQYIIQTGKAENKQTMIIWRDTTGWTDTDYHREVKFFADHPHLIAAARIYVNDDSLIPGAESLTPIFAAKMFGGNNA